MDLQKKKLVLGCIVSIGLLGVLGKSVYAVEEDINLQEITLNIDEENCQEENLSNENAEKQEFIIEIDNINGDENNTAIVQESSTNENITAVLEDRGSNNNTKNLEDDGNENTAGNLESAINMNSADSIEESLNENIEKVIEENEKILDDSSESENTIEIIEDSVSENTLVAIENRESEDTIEIVEDSVSENDLNESDTVLQIDVPERIDFMIDPWEIMGRGQIYSNEFTIHNTGNVPIFLDMSDIGCYFSEESTAVINQDFSTIYNDERKAVYLELVFNFGDRIIISEQSVSYGRILNPGEKIIFWFTGKVSNSSFDKWKSGEISIKFEYSFFSFEN